ncbi:hypothetical protein H2202_011237 [Exophiala xenobiotica]|nr:hypothetical protein H2202_011237 [Exophiala xenobiotica]
MPEIAPNEYRSRIRYAATFLDDRAEEVRDLLTKMETIETDIPRMTEDEREAWVLLNALMPAIRAEVMNEHRDHPLEGTSPIVGTKTRGGPVTAKLTAIARNFGAQATRKLAPNVTTKSSPFDQVLAFTGGDAASRVARRSIRRERDSKKTI